MLTLPELVIVDLDDTIIVSPRFAIDFVAYVSERLGLSIRDDREAPSLTDNFTRISLAAFFDWDHRDSIKQLERDFVSDPANYDLVSGAEGFLDWCKQKETHLLLATMSMGERARGIIKYFDLQFDEVVCRGDNFLNTEHFSDDYHFPKDDMVANFLLRHEILALSAAQKAVEEFDTGTETFFENGRASVRFNSNAPIDYQVLNQKRELQEAAFEAYTSKMIGSTWVIGDQNSDLSVAKRLGQRLAKDSQVTFIAMGEHCPIASRLDYEREFLERDGVSNLSLLHVADFNDLLSRIPAFTPPSPSDPRNG